MWMLLSLIVSSSGADAPATLQSALSFERAGDDERALSALDALLREAPASVLARLEAGRIRLKLARELDQAELDLDAARALAPENPRAQYLWGMLQEERGRAEQALAAYRNAVSFRPTFEDARFRLAGLHFARGEWTAAEEHYRALSGLRPDWTQVRLQLVSALEQQGRWADAEAELVRIRREQPGSKLVVRRLAELYERTNRPEEARRLRTELEGDSGQRQMRPLRKSRK
ncbi:MAG: tetratricopeptide repeat protein [Myxococcaceae bacterium]